MNRFCRLVLAARDLLCIFAAGTVLCILRVKPGDIELEELP